MSLKELLETIKYHIGGVHKYLEFNINDSDAWFDSEYHELHNPKAHFTESKTTVSVEAKPNRMKRLERIVEAKIEAQKTDEERTRDRVSAQWREKQKAKHAHAQKLQLKVISGGNELISRRSQAVLRVVS